MRIKIRFYTAFIAALISTQIQAIVISDFSHSIELKTMVATDAPILKIQLPESVYTHSKSQHLADIRVFNAEMEIVPHTILSTKPIPTQYVIKKKISFITIYNNRNPTPAQFFKNDTLVPGTTQVSNSRPYGGTVSSYIIDLSKPKIRPYTLALNMVSKNHKEFNQSISIQESSDLSEWTTINYRTPIVSLQYLDQTINGNTIRVPRYTKKYLKLVWPETLRNVEIKSIESTAKSFASQERLLIKKFTPAKELLNANEGIYYYPTNGYWPTRTVNLELSGADSTVPGKLYSKFRDASNWLLRADMEFYNLKTQAGMATNAPIKVVDLSPRYWGFKPKDSNFNPEFLPTIVIQWQQKELFLMANGEQPYTMAFGNNEVNTPVASTRLMNYIEDEDNADLAIPSPLKTHPIKSQEPKGIDAFPWSKTILWLSILISVSGFGYMGRKFFLSLNSSQEKDESEDEI